MSLARRRPRVFATIAAAVILGSTLPAAVTTPAAAKQPLAEEIAAAQRQLAALNARVDDAVELYDQAMIALTGAQTSARAAQSRVARSAVRVAQLRGQLGAIAATEYMTGGSPSALQLMTANNPGDYL